MARKKLSDVLSPEQLETWRREGLTCDEIGEKVGFSGKTVSAYGRKVLPPDLLGRKGRRAAKEAEAKEKRPLSIVQIKAELRKRREEAEKRALAKLEQKHEREEEKRRTRVVKVREKIEGQAVAAPVETIKIAPLPNLQEGLFIAAGANGTAAALVTGPGGLQDLLAQQQAHAAWCEFLGEIAPDGELDGLARMTPPRYVRTDADRWDHLRQIAGGYVVTGRRTRKQAQRFLAGEGRWRIVKRSTARWLDLLARLARWLIAREG